MCPTDEEKSGVAFMCYTPTITYTVNEGLPTAFLEGRSLVETDVLFGM